MLNVVVCWKWVALDGGSSTADERWAGVSPADEAALELGLRLAATRPHGEVTVVAVAPAAADAALRRARAAGAHHTVRVDIADAHGSSRDIAAMIAAVIGVGSGARAGGSDYVVCGDYSLDRGTGSVPAFLAAEIGAAQALGLVAIDVEARPLRVVRRLDGGRREVLDVAAPAVLSVEGAVATLRRAPLAASVASTSAPVTVVPGSVRPLGTTLDTALDEPIVTPYRPRARTLPGPVGSTLDRVRDLLDVSGAEASHGELVTLDPPDAARRIIDQLHAWGYLPTP